MTISKPRIWFMRGSWYCHGQWRTGRGHTALAAWQDWQSAFCSQIRIA